MKLVAIGLSLFALAACGPQTYVIQSYDGPVRALETIAILRINSGDPVQVVTVDGEYANPQLAPDSRLHIELLPGEHSVGASTGTTTLYGEESRVLRRLSFRAEPGRVYRVAVAAAAGEPRVFEVDRGNDGQLRDVTVSLPEQRERAGAPPVPAPPAPLPAPEAAPLPEPAAAEPAEPEAPSPAPDPDPTIPPMP